MPQSVDAPLSIYLDGHDVRSQTRATSVGAYVLTIDTVLPDQGIELHSLYLGHKDTKTLVSHLMLAPTFKEALAVEHDHDLLPVVYGRRRCLYDHLQRLQDLLEEIGLSINIAVHDAALRAVEN